MLQKRRMENLRFLGDLRLKTVHLKNNIEISANSLSFHGADRLCAYRGYLSITVEQHLYARHRVRLRFPFLPCVVQHGGNHHCYYYPIELLEICLPQLSPDSTN
ncbi:hypothetical protein niasHS_012621 [Heterodera schachtii]|uniref:Uncharacterized protein n=2 Tax=Heterodera TaxID=34509 RepID=A0ABD2IE81_HETSC